MGGSTTAFFCGNDRIAGPAAWAQQAVRSQSAPVHRRGRGDIEHLASGGNADPFFIERPVATT
jgi:hypothetical protein